MSIESDSGESTNSTEFESEDSSRNDSSRNEGSRNEGSRNDYPQRAAAQQQRRGTWEKFKLERGPAVVIDQFMLCNPQFLKKFGFYRQGEYAAGEDAGFKEALAGAVGSYGGCVIDLDPGIYGVYRDPYQTVILIHPLVSDSSGKTEYPVIDSLLEVASNTEGLGTVYVDTRCVVFIDGDQLRDPELLEKFGALREREAEKEARDLLREHGAAVRYGFSQRGDELQVCSVPGSKTVVLRPGAAAAS